MARPDQNRGKIVTFQEAGAFGDVLVNATGGTVSIEALRLAGADKVGGKVLMDIANEVDHSRGMPPRPWPATSAAWPRRFRPRFRTSRW